MRVISSFLLSFRPNTAYWTSFITSENGTWPNPLSSISWLWKLKQEIRNRLPLYEIDPCLTALFLLSSHCAHSVRMHFLPNQSFYELVLHNKKRWPLCNPDLTVPRSEIQLSKHSCLAKRIKTVGDKRNGIGLPKGHLIECSVVYAHSKRAILLLLKKNRCAIRWLSWLKQARIQQLFQLFLEFCQLRLWHAIGCAGWWLCDRHKVNLMINFPSRRWSKRKIPSQVMNFIRPICSQGSLDWPKLSLFPLSFIRIWSFLVFNLFCRGFPGIYLSFIPCFFLCFGLVYYFISRSFTGFVIKSVPCFLPNNPAIVDRLTSWLGKGLLPCFCAVLYFGFDLVGIEL